MTGPEMRAIRDELGLSAVQLGRAFGYEGNDQTLGPLISRFETGARPIPTYLVRLLLLFQRYGVPAGWTSKLHELIAIPKTGDDE
jgi:hypothetical protein